MGETIHFSIDLSRERFLQYYRGAASAVLVRARDGRLVQIPAASLRPFVSAQGVQGEFVMELDADHRLVALHRR